MAKFPSQRKFVYQTGPLSNDGMTALASGGVTGNLNLPKDLSLLNRRGYASTTRKGVPLVFRCKVDFYMHNEDGLGPSSAADTSAGSGLGSDLQAILKVDGCQSNWVMRNAAVKFHAARENMYKRLGMKKANRGAYAHEIRYNYDSNTDSWLVPIDGDGDAFTGGTWDVTKMVAESDEDIELKLVGSGLNEDSSVSADALQIGHSYLMSRRQVDADSNLSADDTPADRSILNEWLQGYDTPSSTLDAVTTRASDEQDNPPYELIAISDSGDINHDITEPVELGRAVAGFGNAYGSMVVDIPFGLANMRARVFDAADTALNPSGLVCVEVLDIFEMQG